MTVTWSPTKKHADAVLSNGNLTTMHTDVYGHQITLPTQYASGKSYCEITVVKDYDNSNIYYIGIFDDVGAAAASYDEAACTQTWMYNVNLTGTVTGYFCTSGDSGALANGGLCKNGEVIGVAFDADTGDLWISWKGIWLKRAGEGGTPDPATGTIPLFSGISTGTPWYVGVNIFSPGWAWGATANFGGSAFTYTKPSGFTSYDASTDTGWDSGSAVDTGGANVCDFGAPYVDGNSVKADYEVCYGSITQYVGDQHCGYISATDNLTPTTGKWYFELSAFSNVLNYPACHRTTGGFSGYLIDFDSTPTADMLVGIAFDADAEKVWVTYDGTTWDGDPEAGTGGTDFAGPYRPYVNFVAWSGGTYPLWPLTLECGYGFSWQKRTVTAYWGDSGFNYEAPTGFSALYDNADSGEYEVYITEGLGFEDVSASNDVFEGELDENVGFTDYSEAPYPVDVTTSEGFRIGELFQAELDLTYVGILTEGLGFSDAARPDPYGVIEEGIGFGDTAVESGLEVTTDKMGFSEAISAEVIAIVTTDDLSFDLTISETSITLTYEVPTGDADVEFPALTAIGHTGATTSIELPSLTVSATMSRGVFADADIELPSLTATAKSGWTSSVTLPSFEVSATGSVSRVADADITLPMMTMEARAVVSKAILLPALEMIGLVAVGNLLTGSIELPSLTMSGSFVRGNTIDADITLPSLRVSATADRGNFLTADLTLPLITIEATGAPGQNVTATLTLPSLTLEGSYYFDITADGDVTLPALTVLSAGVTDPDYYDGYTLEHSRSRGICA